MSLTNVWTGPVLILQEHSSESNWNHCGGQTLKKTFTRENRINNKRHLERVLVPALFGVARSPPSLPAVVRSTWLISGQQPPWGFSPHRNGTSNLLDSVMEKMGKKKKKFNQIYPGKYSFLEAGLKNEKILNKVKWLCKRKINKWWCRPTDTGLPVVWPNTNLLSLWPAGQPSAQTGLSSVWCWTSLSQLHSASFQVLKNSMTY